MNRRDWLTATLLPLCVPGPAWPVPGPPWAQPGAPSSPELTGLSLVDLLARLLRGQIAPAEVTEAYLARIRRLDDDLHAYVTVTSDAARQRALRLTSTGPTNGGALYGLPIAHKDLFETAGIRTTFGSKWFEQHVPAEDGVVARPGRLSALPRFDTLSTPPFDAPFFRRELAAFEEHAAPVAGAPGGAVFLDRLAERLARHPRRLTHRDFHVDNLLWHGGRVWTVDFQDMRGGPDTYDLVSLVRERAAAAHPVEEPSWRGAAASRLSWESGWQELFWECAAQRGLKVLGTFLRLAAAGRPGYLVWLPDVAAKTLEALAVLDAPDSLRRTVSHLRDGAARAGDGESPASV